MYEVKIFEYAEGQHILEPNYDKCTQHDLTPMKDNQVLK